MRYILFDSRHLDASKTDAAADIVAAAGLKLHVERVQTVIQTYLTLHPEERDALELVVSAVDSYDARREITSELPRTIVNAGTTPRDFTISRHRFADGYACLACLYPARPEDAVHERAVARELGLEQTEVTELRRTKTPLTVAHLAKIARARGLAGEHYASYVGEPLDSFYNKEFCAKVAVPTSRGEAVAPLAFGSALAGFLLAHAVACEAGPVRRFRLDFLAGLTTPQRTAPRARSACRYCGRPEYRTRYTERWG